MNAFIKIELVKYLRKFNAFFAIFTLLYLLLMCYANLNVGILQREIFTRQEYLNSITEEFARNCLILLPVWTIVSAGIDFSNFVIQKHVTDGLTRTKYLKSKIVQGGLIAATMLIIYLVIVVALMKSYFSTVASTLPISFLQVMLFAIGYQTLAFVMLLIFRSTLRALIAFFVLVLMEFVITYLLKTVISNSFQVIGPVNIIRRMGFNSSSKFVSLAHISFTDLLIYSFLIAFMVIFGSYYFIKKEFKPI